MKKYSAMIVDDSETDRYLLKRFLGKTELVNEILEAENGLKALEFLKEFEKNKVKYPNGFPPTFLFLDVNMPLMGGFEFLKEYEKLEKNNKEISIVVMMFSSSGSEEDKSKASEFKCVKDYLEKGSFKVEDLKAKIIKHTEN